MSGWFNKRTLVRVTMLRGVGKSQGDFIWVVVICLVESLLYIISMIQIQSLSELVVFIVTSMFKIQCLNIVTIKWFEDLLQIFNIYVKTIQ